ncbi:MAG: undecaprenyldiphospho-muramoylpentapeptide beta-N-acetylglucosaminyltransferase [Sphaerochaetaceae bacterium]|nr:undecaprenyldiphospho-muramoylpentapeptide beta-N-acetylglucosaminyltransferase [Spirochaetales bacterium]MDY5500747.1 undecaprenyldiphospho-muramoylpentapeptide beta-N-acetylglucosaminyltransferase [Sphaerochaetaceae bacterium]
MRVCYTGGGTLGHVLPALSVHAILKTKPGYECLFIGSRKKSERSAVESACVPFAGIFSGKLRRYFTFKTLLAGFGVLFGFLQSLVILSRYRPDVLFSKGGYVSVPPVLAAHLLRIPVVIHESDATAGLANRISSRYASRICVPFDGAGKEFPQEKVVVTGNPIRPSLLVLSGRDFKKEKGIAGPLILVLGGSQGAKEVNSLIWNQLDRLCRQAVIWHQCGSRDWKGIRHQGYHQCRFITDDMAALYEAADLVVSRSGAGAISELCHYGKPSILIPLRSGSRGDQVVNAKRMEKAGAALVWTGEKDLASMVEDLLASPGRLETMARNAESLDKSDATERVAEVIEQVGANK